jgi:hypothetical protein
MPPSWGYQDSVIVQGTLESHSDEALYEFGRVLAPQKARQMQAPSLRSLPSKP